MHKLALLSKQADEYRRLLEAASLPDLEIVAAPAPDCDLAFGEPVLIRERLSKLPGLRWAQSTWAGVEPLLDPSLRRDYTLTNARGVFGPLMSEYVFAYLLLHERRILGRIQSQQECHWDPSETGVLRGKTLGLLGVGSIGCHLAATARHFGMEVRGFTRAGETCPHVSAYHHNDLPSFAAGLDYLVCTLPGAPGTRRLVDAALLEALPAHALFINVGRGSVVDEPALAAALSSGKIAGAVLDVFEQEPLPSSHIFWETPNLLLTFHTAAPSFPEDIAGLFIENYQLLLDGKPLRYQVDFERGY
ncbi:MAG: D-2-hydroxyacid dehydrogenase [Chloroflexota bacterium]